MRPEDHNRQTGRTAKQMLEAPHGAVFVWCNLHIDYPMGLACQHGREDLRIATPSWLENPDRIRGLELTGVVLDHAVVLDERTTYGLEVALSRVRIREDV